MRITFFCYVLISISVRKRITASISNHFSLKSVTTMSNQANTHLPTAEVHPERSPLLVLPDTSSTDIPSAIKFDAEPANHHFVEGYSKCVALYITYLETHPEWRRTPGRALLHAMERKPVTPEESKVFNRTYSIMIYLTNNLSWVRFRETDYMMALCFLERFYENTKDEFTISQTNVPMTILVSLLTTNKLTSEVPVHNRTFYQALSIYHVDLLNSEMYFLSSLHMNLSFTEEHLWELEKICECCSMSF